MTDNTEENVGPAKGDDVTTPAVTELGVEEARRTQFPSLHGQEGVEVAERSADETADEATKFRKDFVLIKADYDGGDKKSIHAANKDAVRQFLINQGLRPTGDVSVSTKAHPDGVSIILTYKVAATPAIIVENPDVAHARVDGEPPLDAAPEGDDK
jgi:hypothetical protein